MLGFDLGIAVSLLRFQNQFEDLGRIGSGGFSTVYKVRNIRDRKMYALKIITIKPSQIKHQIYEYFERKLTQVRILSSLTHPNIVTYHGCWINAEMKTESQQEDLIEQIIEQQELQLVIDEYSSQSMGFQFERRSQSSQKSKKTKITKQKNKINKIDQNIYEIDLYKYKQIKIYLLSELGEITLQKYVQLRNEQKQRNQLSRNTFVIENYQFIGDIISGLEYMHGQRVIHRDIKLNNIILNAKKQCKIIDFGLAKKVKSIKLANYDRKNNQNQEQFQYFNEKHSSCIGTKIFSSPQQATSQNYDHRTDIYSLGMVIGVLFSEYNTQHEQRQILMNLRNRKFDNFNMDERLKRILFECLGRQEQRPDLKQIKSVIKTLLKEQIQNNMQNFYKQKRDKNGQMELELNKQFRNLLNEKQLVKQNQ